jgi:AraC-like DNA-binding protein
MNGETRVENCPYELHGPDGEKIDIRERELEETGRILPRFTNTCAKGGYGTINCDHFSGEGFSVWYTRYDLIDEITWTAQGNLHDFGLHIPLYGSVVDDRYSKAGPGGNEIAVSYMPFFTHLPATVGSRFCTIDIRYSRRYLENFEGFYGMLVRVLAGVYTGGKTGGVVMGDAFRFMSLEIAEQAASIARYNMAESMAARYYESAVNGIIVTAVNRLCTLANAPAETYSAYDKERTKAVRDLIASDLGTRLTIPQLARKAGLNASKLQTCFKQLYGVTIFDFSRSERLNLARYLLRETPDPIHEIAFRCAYSDHPNFTQAFKSRFGCTPESCRAEKKLETNSQVRDTNS